MNSMTNDEVMANGQENRLTPSPEDIRKRFDTLVHLYEEHFLLGLEAQYRERFFLSKELLHCAVNAYFDDIYKYKMYAGSKYADRHKQAAYTMLWITRFHPIQIKPDAEVDTVVLTVNEAFALYAGFMFLDPIVISKLTKRFYCHLIYTLTYRNLNGKGLATLIYLLETGASKGVQF